MNNNILIVAGVAILLIITLFVFFLPEQQPPEDPVVVPQPHYPTLCDTYACVARAVQSCERGVVAQYTPARPSIEQYGFSGWQRGSCIVTQEIRTQQGTQRTTCTYSNADVTDIQVLAQRIAEGCE